LATEASQRRWTPDAALIQAERRNFYGTTFLWWPTTATGTSGEYGYGTVFRMTPAGR